MAKGKYAKLPQLYVTGDVLELRDGTVMWLQVLNPYEVHEARKDAQIARARLVLALKGPEGSEERDSVEASFLTMGREESITQLVDLGVVKMLPGLVAAIEDDPEWKQRVEVLNRTDEIVAKPPEDAEHAMLDRINREYIEEVERRQSDERAALRLELENVGDEEVLSDLINVVVDHRGNEVATAEYALTEAMYAARVCEAVRDDDAKGGWNHDACPTSHEVRIWDDKVEVRNLPEDLQEEIYVKLRELNMSVREAKNSARQGSSSDSPPLPSEPAESTPSTSPVIPEEAPGTSSKPSLTLSTS